MALMTQDLKKKIVADIKSNLKDEKVRIGFTSRVEHHSSLRININRSSVDLYEVIKETMLQRIEQHSYPQRAKDMIEVVDGRYDINFAYIDLDWLIGCEDTRNAIKAVMRGIEKHHYDNSDPMTDYFDCAFYFDIVLVGERFKVY